MPDWGLLAAFVPTFLLVSFTPGLCMTLSMTLGITVGIRRALWMMLGELLGVGLVAWATVLGVAALMVGAPAAFAVFRWLGGAWLVWLGLGLWRAKGRFVMPDGSSGVGRSVSRRGLALQGFLTAVANPKGWAFFAVLLPPFMDDARPALPQMAALVTLLLCIEALALITYAAGGRALGRVLARRGNLALLERVAGSLLIAVGVWLAVG